jgi:lipopolysaccharide export system permease protein
VKRLHKLVIKTFIGPFFLIFFIVLFLLLMQFLWRYIDDLVGKGLEFHIISELLMYTSASLVPLALPLSILMSSLMTFGSMGEYSELTAIKSSGVSLQRIMFPLIIIVSFISFGAFFFSNNVLPFTNLKMRSLLYDVRQQRPELQIKPGEFYSGIDNYSIRVNSKDPETNILYGIKIYDHTGRKGNRSVTIADSGLMKITVDERNLLITLWNGISYDELVEDRRKRAKTYPHRINKFKKQRLILELTGFGLQRTDENLFKNNYQMMNLSQLDKAKDSLRKELYLRNAKFYSDMVNTNYFKLRNRYLVKRQAKYTKLKKDSAYIQDPVNQVKFDFDSLFANFSIGNKRRISSNAIAFARSSKSYVENTALNLTFKSRHLRKHEIEWHRKFTLSFACLVFLFIGAPLGAIIRKGGIGMPTVISTLMFILYYIISLTGEKLIRGDILSPLQGMWMSSFILLVAGGFITYKATTDSAILNIDTYLDIFRRSIGIDRIKMLDLKSHLTGKFDFTVIKKKDLNASLNSLIESTITYIKDVDTNRKFPRLIYSYVASLTYIRIEEFQRNYNQIVDSIISSNWFKVSYIQTKVNDFPVILFKRSKSYFSRIYRILALIIIPVGIFLVIKHYIALKKLRKHLVNVAGVSQSIIDILDSPSLLKEFEIQK